MSKKKVIYCCSKCDYQTGKWLGRCPHCDEWNSFEQLSSETFYTGSSRLDKSSRTLIQDPLLSFQKLSEIQMEKFENFLTKIEEFDRLLGNGLTKDSITLFGGEPGVGKSTLLLCVCKALVVNYPSERFLYISGEETKAQIKERCIRVGLTSENFYISHEMYWQKILEYLATVKPTFLIIDSIQTIMSQDVLSVAGSPSQVREVTAALIGHAKLNNITCFIVGHVTKEGGLAGPKLLEHMVDTVLYLEGDPASDNRQLRPIKNRFGSTNEVGFFKLNMDGVSEVKDIANLFYDKSIKETYGRALTCLLNGNRPLFVEVQSLVVENKFGGGKKVTQGVELNRLSLLAAIVDKYLGLPISVSDVYVNIVGGLKLKNRDCDLAIVASLISSSRAVILKKDILFLGEVGLTGEIRSVPQIETILKELETFGHKKIVTSESVAIKYSTHFNLDIVGLSTVKELDFLICG